MPLHSMFTFNFTSKKLCLIDIYDNHKKYLIFDAL